MKNRHKLMFAIDRMWNRKFICILNIVLMTVSFVLIEQAAHIYNKTTYLVKEVDRITKVDTDRLVMVEIKDLNYEDVTLSSRISAFIDELSDCNGVVWSGTYMIEDTLLDGNVAYDLTEIYETYRERAYSDAMESVFSESLDREKRVNVLKTNLDVLTATGVDVSNVDIDAFEECKDYIPVLAGAKLAEVLPVGTELKFIGDYNVKVIGAIEEESYFYGTSIFDTPRGYIDLSGYLIVPENSDIGIDTLYNDSVLAYVDVNVEKTLEEINTLAKTYRLTLKLTTLKEKYEIIDDEYENVDEIFMYMAFIVALTIVSVIITSVVQVLTKRNEMGILYSSGFTTKNLIEIMLIENCFKIFIAWGFVILKQFLNIKTNILYDRITREIEKSIFVRYDLPFMFIVLVALPIIVTVIPALLLKCTPIREMVGDN